MPPVTSETPRDFTVANPSMVFSTPAFDTPPLFDELELDDELELVEEELLEEVELLVLDDELELLDELEEEPAPTGGCPPQAVSPKPSAERIAS